jgi:methyl coenzyme M reductase subunit C-like uncharacterized protein (methanogenesis marker protein 7)
VNAMMNIIFLGSTGVHQTLLAAYLHLDLLSGQDYQLLPHFNDYKLEASGRPLYIGSDTEGRNIHSLGVGDNVEMIAKTIEQLRIILDSSADELEIIPINIKPQRLISLIHQLARFASLKPLSSKLIAHLVSKEYDPIMQQIPRLNKWDIH